MGKRKNERMGEQKMSERIYLDQLITLYPGFPEGRILASESPDFLVFTNRKRKTGIELTRLTRDPGTSYSGEGHFHPDFSLESMQQLIRHKEAKLKLYQKKGVEGVWLVILVESFSHSPAFNIRNHLDKWRLETSFSAVLVFDLSLQTVYELKTPDS
jgi:hypothetical protein